VPRLSRRGWWHCPEEVAANLARISAKTADRLLAPKRRRLRLDQRRGSSMRRLLLEQIPVKKVAEEWQVDRVAHWGQSTAGSFLWTLSTVDIATNWWEGEPVMSAPCAVDAIRRRLPFRLREIHPHNDNAVLNHLLMDYCRENRIALSRSRPLKKNDNCWVEQNNWTHVRKQVGYHRLSGGLQYRLLKDLYGGWSLWRNYFQPVEDAQRGQSASPLRRAGHTLSAFRWLRASSARRRARV
jgi:hypothetical protein